MSNIRVLLIAELASPNMVSVPLEGWSHCQAIARQTQAHIVTQVRSRDAFVEHGLVEGKDFTAIDNEYVARRFDNMGRFFRGGQGKGWTTRLAFQTVAYYAFEKMVWKQFETELRNGKYDLVHRVIPLSPTSPSTIAKKLHKIGVPFLMGPLNGGVPWPKAFSGVRRQEKEWLSYVRNVYKLMPGYSATRKYAKAIIAGSRDTLQQIDAKYQEKTVYIPENAIDPARFTARRTRTTSKPIRLIFVGRLVPYKGCDMLLEAAAPLLKSGEMTLNIVGDGPQRGELGQLVAKLEIQSAVKFAGWVKHTELQQQYLDADVFTFPSIREFGGAVALEAMAVGLVPIVMNYGGLGELVTEKTGFLLEMSTRDKIVAQLRDTLQKIAENPGLIDERTGPALARAHEKFTWDAKASQVVQVYNWVLGRGPKPEFPAPIPD